MIKRVLLALGLSCMLGACVMADGSIVLPVDEAGNITLPEASEGGSTGAETPVSSASLQAFQSEFATQSKTPQGAVRMLFKALVELENDQAVAEQLLGFVINGQQLEADADSPSGYRFVPASRFMLDQIRNRPNTIRSYIGGTPERDYANFDRVNLPLDFPADNSMVGSIRIDNSAEDEGAGIGRIYIKSAGKDEPTPINMAKNGRGEWKIDLSSLSSIATGVKSAPVTDF